MCIRDSLKAGVSGKIDIEGWHLVETDDAVGRTSGQVVADPGSEPRIAALIGQSANRHQQNFKTLGNFAAPLDGVDLSLIHI